MSYNYTVLDRNIRVRSEGFQSSWTGTKRHKEESGNTPENKPKNVFNEVKVRYDGIFDLTVRRRCLK